MKEALKIDLTGALVDVELVADDAPDVTDVYEPNPNNPDELVIVAYLVSKKVPAGTFIPVWDLETAEWKEGMSQEEIDAIRNAVPPKTDRELLDESRGEIGRLNRVVDSLSVDVQAIIDTIVV